MDAHSVVDDWDTAPFDGGFGGIGALKSRGFDGAIEADGTWLFLRDGEALTAVADLDVNPRPGDVDAFEGATGRQHEAPTAGVATVAAMLALGGDVRGTYFTDDTPLSAVDETLSGGGFTGYVELSENVLSGDYYYVYVDGAVEHVAFVGSEQLLVGEEAESRAEGEVGIYDVVAVELSRPDVPEPESPPEPGPEPEPAPTADAGLDADANIETDAGQTVSSDSGPDSDPPPDAESASASRAGSGPSRYGGTADSDPDNGSGADAAGKADSDTAGGTETKLEVDTSWLERDDEPDADTGEDAIVEADGTESEPSVEADGTESEPGAEGDIPGGAGVETARDEPATDEGASGDGERPDDEETGLNGATGDDARRDDRDGTSVAAIADDETESTASDATAGGATTDAPPDPSERATLDREDDDARIERYEIRIEELEADLAAADARIEELEAECESLRADRDDLRRRVKTADASTAESLSPEAALAETRLFVRQRSRGEGTLSDAHDGADREAVVSNLHIEYHTTFDDEAVSVEGEPFETWLRASDAYAFVEWLTTELLFEIRSANHLEAVRPLYDALPDVDRIGFEETIAVGDGTEGREIGFDLVARDKSGHPLVVGAFDRGRDPTYADAVEPFVADAADVCAAHETLAGAVAITSSYFESDAMSVVGEATSSSLLSRSRYRSYVKLSRTNGYHLCLVEARDGSFNLTVPEL
ncbi:uncharacterized protein Nmlp_1686 [Natronomonas moolapensis 8.8.11]|uniref:DUF7527 domain-containing protein n=1 Tax=Natronomonas moolapensis (strain DSM 18674 / CECT 7526 / JCM 14361 / 8.8.11) TaxID=268739 RepID=M1Y0B3_NATM8|nr:hypothetical protein [Natronomonas moolapensis]CCQ35881.1 uncharacterized protein Nmlp_1686 [Natronomonas moolapensis 8.8.11]